MGHAAHGRRAAVPAEGVAGRVGVAVDHQALPVVDDRTHRAVRPVGVDHEVGEGDGAGRTLRDVGLVGVVTVDVEPRSAPEGVGQGAVALPDVQGAVGFLGDAGRRAAGSAVDADLHEVGARRRVRRELVQRGERCARRLPGHDDVHGSVVQHIRDRVPGHVEADHVARAGQQRDHLLGVRPGTDQPAVVGGVARTHEVAARTDDVLGAGDRGVVRGHAGRVDRAVADEREATCGAAVERPPGRRPGGQRRGDVRPAEGAERAVFLHAEHVLRGRRGGHALHLVGPVGRGRVVGVGRDLPGRDPGPGVHPGAAVVPQRRVAGRLPDELLDRAGRGVGAVEGDEEGDERHHHQLQGLHGISWDPCEKHSEPTMASETVFDAGTEVYRQTVPGY